MMASKRAKQGHTRWATAELRGPDDRIELVYVLSCRVAKVSRRWVYYTMESDSQYTLHVTSHRGWRGLFPTYRKAMRHAVESCKRTDTARDAEYLEAWDADLAR